MELLGGLLSPFVMRVALAARFKGHDLAVRPPGDMQAEAYRALNPMGRMPTLVDADWALPESSVIAAYLDETLEGPPLLPAEARARARVRLLERVIDLDVIVHLVPLFRAASDPAGVPGAKEQLARGLGHVATLAAANGPWLAGAQPGIADCALMPVAFFLRALDGAHGTASLLPPRLSAWWSHAGASPQGERMVGEMRAAMTKFMAER